MSVVEKSQCRNKPAIQKYGELILERYNLASSRKEFTFDFNIDFNIDFTIYNNIDEQITLTNSKIRTFLEKTLHFTEEQSANAVIVHKTIDKPGLKWHIDDCQLVNFKQNAPSYNLEQYIHLEGSKYLYFNTPTKTLPKFTVLFYSSTYKEDFDGGILHFVDGLQIMPQKQKGFVMDSREAHMVGAVSRGVRNVSVVKIY